MALINLKLRVIEMEADFRFSERTLFVKFREKNTGVFLAPDDCVAFVSRTGNQIVFVYNSRDFECQGEAAIKVTTSVRIRIDQRRAWNPLMLQNYANEAGINLVGLKRYEQLYRELMGNKLKGRKTKETVAA